jgi:hypothetical protein
VEITIINSLTPSSWFNFGDIKLHTSRRARNVLKDMSFVCVTCFYEWVKCGFKLDIISKGEQAADNDMQANKSCFLCSVVITKMASILCRRHFDRRLRINVYYYYY